MNDYEKNVIGHLKELDDERLQHELYRATGGTTKKCDELVQKFFEAPYGEWVPVIDHYGTRQADEMLLRMFLKRMELEHPNEVEIDRRGLRVRRKNKTYHEMVVEEYNNRHNG